MALKSTKYTVLLIVFFSLSCIEKDAFLSLGYYSDKRSSSALFCRMSFLVWKELITFIATNTDRDQHSLLMKTKLYLTAIALLIFHGAIFSQTHTWTGNGNNTSWFNVDNWDDGSVPSASSNVLIPDGFTVEISESVASANAIEISGVSSLNIANDLSFTDQLIIHEGSNIYWTKGIINGGGTIENDGLIKLESFDDKELVNSTIENNGTIFISNSNIIRFSEGVLINNYENAFINIMSQGGIIQDDTGNAVNNYGTIRKFGDGSEDPSNFYMIFDLNNTGLVEVGENQTFLFLGESQLLNNMETGIMKGFGTFDITSTFTNIGTFAPGNDVTIGTLSVVNYFSLSSQAILNFDIAGTDQGEFDVIDVFGFPNLEGNIELNLSYAPSLGDEFTIITANEITSCDFPASITAQFEGNTYTFEIICNDTSVVLQVTDIILGVEDNEYEHITLSIVPNPVKNNANILFNAPDEVLFNARDITLYFYNPRGHLAETITGISKGYNSFNTSNLAAGVYFLKLISESKVLATTKMVVIK